MYLPENLVRRTTRPVSDSRSLGRCIWLQCPRIGRCAFGLHPRLQDQTGYPKGNTPTQGEKTKRAAQRTRALPKAHHSAHAMNTTSKHQLPRGRARGNGPVSCEWAPYELQSSAYRGVEWPCLDENLKHNLEVQLRTFTISLCA